MSNTVVIKNGPTVTLNAVAGPLPAGYAATGNLPVYDPSKTVVSTSSGNGGWITSYDSGTAIIAPEETQSSSSTPQSNSTQTDDANANPDTQQPLSGTFTVQAESNAVGANGANYLIWNGLFDSASAYAIFDLNAGNGTGNGPYALTGAKWFGAPSGAPGFLTNFLRGTVAYQNQLSLALAYSDEQPTISQDGQSVTLPADASAYSSIPVTGTLPDHAGTFGFESFIITLPFYLRANLLLLTATDSAGASQDLKLTDLRCYSSGDRSNIWGVDSNRLLPAPLVIDKDQDDVTTGYSPSDFPSNPSATIAIDPQQGDTSTGYGSGSTTTASVFYPAPSFIDGPNAAYSGFDQF